MKIALHLLDARAVPACLPKTMVSVTSADLKALVRRLIDDPSTSTAIRNQCHLLLIAIDGNHRVLIEERLHRLTQLLDASNVKTAP